MAPPPGSLIEHASQECALLQVAAPLTVLLALGPWVSLQLSHRRQLVLYGRSFLVPLHS